MKLIITGLIIDFLIMISIYPSLSSEPRYEELAFPFVVACVISWVISLIGVLFVVSKKYKAGIAFMIIGSIVYLPLGFIAVFGASKLRSQNDSSSELDLARRRELNTNQASIFEKPLIEQEHITPDKEVLRPAETNVPQSENLEYEVLTFSAAKFVTQQRILGIISLIMGIATVAFIGMGGLFIAMGVLWIFMSVVMSTDSYITLGSDYITMKWGIRAPVSVLFKEITSIEKTEKKVTFYYKASDQLENKTKKLVLALNVIPDEEKVQFLQAFDKRVHTSKMINIAI